MTPAWARRDGAALTAIAIVALEPVVRVLAGGGYLGATALLVLACGLALLPTLPRELGALSVRVAVVPGGPGWGCDVVEDVVHAHRVST